MWGGCGELHRTTQGRDIFHLLLLVLASKGDLKPPGQQPNRIQEEIWETLDTIQSEPQGQKDHGNIILVRGVWLYFVPAASLKGGVYP